jgi:glucokinase
VTQAGELFFAPLRAAFAEHAGMDYVRRCRIVPAALGRSAGLAGAAALVLDGRASYSRYWETDWSEL